MRAVGGRMARSGEVAGVRGVSVRNTARKLEDVAEVAEVEAEVLGLVEGGVVPRWAPIGPGEELSGAVATVAVWVLVLVKWLVALVLVK